MSNGRRVLTCEWTQSVHRFVTRQSLVTRYPLFNDDPESMGDEQSWNKNHRWAKIG
ncbi:MAG TPA: hypothetical protein VJ991_01960 [Balneolales bacterium]|nr:hypothetical protein [Balneolales bacterium]HYX09542.1 hypothetical protein [Bacteroidales bacterium]